MRFRTLSLVLIVLAVGIVVGRSLSPAVPSEVLDALPADEPNTAIVPAVARTALTATDEVDDPVPGNLTPGERRTIEVFRQASRSTVNITSVAYRRNWFSLDAQKIAQGSGTGFVWDDDGHIVTNFHVVQGGQEFEVTLSDQSTFQGRVIGVAPDKDLAVIRIEAPRNKLDPLELGTSADLVVGQSVYAVGNPFGLDHTLTVGVVSALGRELTAPDGRTIRDVIQTDAAINPGNSGGPLLDSSGRVVGVNSAIYSPSGASAGIGFAVPADTVRRLIPQLILYGQPKRVGIGIEVLPDNVARRYRFDGIVVKEVRRGGPAHRAGIERVTIARDRSILGDQIVAVDGERVMTTDELLHHFERAGAGARVTLTLLNRGKTRDVEVELDEL